MTLNKLSQTDLDVENEQTLRQQLRAKRLRLKASDSLDTRVTELLRNYIVGFNNSSGPKFPYRQSHTLSIWRIIMQRKSTSITVTAALVMVVLWIQIFLTQAGHNRVWANKQETKKGKNLKNLKFCLNLPP
jgi:hypothetical protein